MDPKRPGMANVPIVVVPDHILEGFARVALYPQARPPSAGSVDIKTQKADLSAQRQFVAGLQPSTGTESSAGLKERRSQSRNHRGKPSRRARVTVALLPSGTNGRQYRHHHPIGRHRGWRTGIRGPAAQTIDEKKVVLSGVKSGWHHNLGLERNINRCLGWAPLAHSGGSSIDCGPRRP
jgi:hypothetical protein